MRAWTIVAAASVLAACAQPTVESNASRGTNTAVVSPQVRLDAENARRLQRIGAEILFWPQDKREATFRAMETVFPGHIVEAGERVRPLPPGPTLPVDPAAIDAFMAAQKVAGLIVVQDGRVRLERYGIGFSREGRWTSFSVAKSFTSTLVGAAIRDGAIGALTDPVTRYIPELAGSGYDGVTVEQLLTMTSGVRWNEDYTDPNSDVARMYAAEVAPDVDPTVAYMRTLPRDTPPGTRWVYKTGETNLIGVLVRNATGVPLATYLSEKVWKPYGMERDAFWMIDPSGHAVSGCCLSVSLRDYARIGQFALEGGRGVVPDGWFEQATRSHADFARAGYGYGYQWWVYPGGRFGAQGIFGQSVLVDPESRTVIAIVGAWPTATGAELSAERAEFQAVLVEAAKRGR